MQPWETCMTLICVPLTTPADNTVASRDSERGYSGDSMCSGKGFRGFGAQDAEVETCWIRVMVVALGIVRDVCARGLAKGGRRNCGPVCAANTWRTPG